MNKVIKFVLLMLFAVISFSAANIIKNDLADSKIKQIYNVQGYKQIFLPSSIDKNEELVSIMKGVSEKNDTPFLFRSVYIGVENNNNGNPNLLKEKNDVMFFSSKNLPQNSKTILSHGFTYNFFYEFLSEMSSVQLTNSDIYISDKHLNSTLQELSKVFNQKYKLKINSQKLMVRPSDYPPTSYTDFISYNNYNLVFFITVSIIFFSIFLFVWLMANNKAISIYRLNGLSAYKIGKQLFLKEFATVSLATYLVASLVAFRAFNFDYTLQMLSLSGLVVILSYISIAIVSSFSLTNQLNSKPFFKYSYFILYAVKAFVFFGDCFHYCISIIFCKC
ncbi:hypothetical protein [Lactococcus lactis]|uniref:hypothetical protein n=1 Tax=Lactococcus lactis TaxID=1358 RepID=UPI000ABBDC5D|nr:hypothetical protein [Lactococcus lactis]